MKILGEKGIASVIKRLLQALFIIGIIIMLGFPIVGMHYVTSHMIEQSAFEIAYPIVIIYFTGVPALAIVYEFIKLFGLLKQNQPFVGETVEYLKNASTCSFIIVIAYAIIVAISSYFWHTSIMLYSVIVVGIFSIAWIGLYILAELFKQAISYKEENDLTI